MVQSGAGQHSTASYSYYYCGNWDYWDWGLFILKARTSRVAEKCWEIILDSERCGVRSVGFSSLFSLSSLSSSSSSSFFPDFAGVVKARRLCTGASSSSELISLRLIKNQWLGIIDCKRYHYNFIMKIIFKYLETSPKYPIAFYFTSSLAIGLNFVHKSTYYATFPTWGFTEMSPR